MKPSRSSMLSFIALAIAALVWLAVTEMKLVNPKVLVSPIALINEFLVLMRDGYLGTPLYVHLFASLARTTVGFVCGAVLAMPVGLAIGYNPTIYALVSPFLSLLRPIPVIAYIPLTILWFGIGEFSKILLIAITSFLYMTVNTAAGVKAVPVDIIRAAQSLGVSRVQLFRNVIFPHSLPYIFAGLRVGAAVSWAVVVSVELIAAQQGLGYVIMDAATFFRITDVYVGIALIGVVGFAIDRLITFAEKTPGSLECAVTKRDHPPKETIVNISDGQSPLLASRRPATEMDSQYDLRAAFPDYPDYFESWRERSHAVRNSCNCALDLPYGDGERERLDLFPAPRANGPFFFFVHGGYWRFMDKSDFSFIVRPYLARGISVALMNYALCPGPAMHVLIEQTQRAIAWVHENAQRHDATFSELHLGGWSAGAHLAAMAFAQGSAASSLLAISGIYDLNPMLSTSANEDLRLDEEQARINSPIERIPPANGRVAVVWGANETSEFCRQSRAFFKSWSEKGARPDALEVPDVHHYSVMDKLADENSPVLQASLRLIGRR